MPARGGGKELEEGGGKMGGKQGIGYSAEVLKLVPSAYGSSRFPLIHTRSQAAKKIPEKYPTLI